MDSGYDSGMRNQQRSRNIVVAKSAKKSRNTQTSLRLPETLYARAKEAVEAGATGSVNELLVKALTAYLRALERRAIDEAFKPMAEDAVYQREALKIAEQFAVSDAESLRLSEQDLVGL